MAEATSPVCSRAGTLAACALIVLAALAAYANSFQGIFVYDDKGSIPDNPTIRTLWPLTVPLSPDFADGRTVDGRPVLNLSFALSHALSGTETWSYHAVNLLLHIACGLLLFAILHRVLSSPKVPRRVGEAAVPLACAVAVLWVVHPVQAQSVTYIVQRAESLSVFFYLLTIYAFVRGVETSRVAVWHALSVACCFLGVGTKESVVTAPLMALLYDRTFLAGSFGRALRLRWRSYLGLAAAWAPLAWLMLGTESRGGTAGFGTAMSPWTYALTQCEGVVRYLRLSFWPRDLVFDYGRYRVTDWRLVWPQIALLAALGGATFYALWRRPVLGFALCSVFLVLAPTSSVVPIPNQTLAEHRMYLPLAGLLALAACGLYFCLRKASYFVFAAAAAALALATFQRNTVYHSELALWRDTISKWPWNARGQVNLARTLVQNGRLAEAWPHYVAVIQIEPNYPEIYEEMATVAVRAGELANARWAFARAVKQAPGSAGARANLANVFLQAGNRDEARVHAAEALRLDPSSALAHGSMGMILVSERKPLEALGHFRRAVELAPQSPENRNNLGMTLANLGRREEALEQFREALRINPDYEQARTNVRRYSGEGR